MLEWNFRPHAATSSSASWNGLGIAHAHVYRLLCLPRDYTCCSLGHVRLVCVDQISPLVSLSCIRVYTHALFNRYKVQSVSTVLGIRALRSCSLGDIVEAMTNILTPVPTSLPATLAAVVTGPNTSHRQQQSCYTSSRAEGAVDAPHHHHALHQLQA